MVIDSGRAIVLPAPGAPSAPYNSHSTRRFRARTDQLAAELRRLGFSVPGLAQASGIPLPVLLAALDHGCSKATARRLVRGMSILAGRRYRADELVVDLLGEGAA